MVVGAVLIRFNGAIAERLTGTVAPRDESPVQTSRRPTKACLGRW